MNELQVVEQNGQLLVDSRDVAEMFGKKHKNVIGDIKRIIEREKDFVGDFIESFYISKQNKKIKKYLITEKGKKRLIARYEHRAKSASLEKAFGKWITTLFPKELIISQYNVLDYKIDFYMADLGICIEYDETEHKYQKEADMLRQREIQEELKRDYLENIEYDQVVLIKDASESFPFIRIKEGQEIEGIRELLILIRNHTMSDIVNYME